MNRWLGCCLLLLLVTTTNAAGADDELTDTRTALRSMRLELDSTGAALQSMRESTGAALQSMRLALDAVVKENNALSARLRAIEPVPTADSTHATNPGKKQDSSNARRLTESSGATASIGFDGTDLQISSPVAVGGDLTASGAVSGASVTASGAVSSASVTASGAVSGNSLTSTQSATVGGDLTVSGNIYRSTVIAFSAYSTYAGGVVGTAQLPFNAVKLNLGNGYSTSNPCFTAPVAGVYSFSLYAASGGAYSIMEFIIEGAWDGVKSYGSSVYTAQGFTIIRQLSAGGTVYPYVSSGTIYMTDGTPSVSTFSGFLIAAT